MTSDLGRLERVDLRDFWKDETRDFTPWLARVDNLELLGEAIGIDIELEDTNVEVGSFKADLVAKDIGNDRTVIIENQLERTNHDHLGKIITYASGLGADIVIWICRSVTEEHRRAIDWLNEITSEEIAFFAIEIELWKIIDSMPAPKFNVVCRPNIWAKSVKETSGVKTMTETKLLYEKFWSGLKDYMKQNQTYLELRKPRPSNSYSFAVGKSRFRIRCSVSIKNNRLGCELYLAGARAKSAFVQLKKDDKEIEDEIGSPLEWRELPEGQDSRIILHRNGSLRDESNWSDYFQWFQEYSEKFHKAFSKRIKRLQLSGEE